MNLFKTLGSTAGKAICYSGYRDGQSPNPEYTLLMSKLSKT